ncbi:MAG: cation diffusion facilitator family transporter [Thermodesulfobacteriota bacterium]
MKNNRIKKRAALLSISVSFVLFILKIVFGFLTNSLSIITSAVDSFLDLSASTINYFSISHSVRPADEEHKYGHEKAEGIAGLVQSLIIIISSIYLIYESIKRLGSETLLTSLDKGIIVMVISLVVSYFLSNYLKKTATKTESIALHADSFHFRADLYTNLTILIGLIIVKLSGLLYVDSIVTILISAYIIYSAYMIIQNSLDILMDKELPEEMINLIEITITRFSNNIKGFHKLRTRNTGSKKFIEFHLEVNNELSFVESHDLAEQLIKKLELEIPNSEIIVHVDPFGHPDYS